jgi:hypothetical protein
MKAAKLFITVIAIGSLFTFSNCGDSKPAAEPLPDKQLRLLTGTNQVWKLTAVTLDGVDQLKTATPAGPYDKATFTLTLSGTKGSASFNYAVAGRPALSPWKTSGTWTFGTDPATQITRDPSIVSDKLEMTYNVTDPAATLSIQFNFQGAGYTRTDQVKGNWVFTFGL